MSWWLEQFRANHHVMIGIGRAFYPPLPKMTHFYPVSSESSRFQ
jgi:hypothetical protein